MAELTSKKRKSLSKGTFGLPGKRKYPMPDKAHAANAKARATQMVAKGKLSEGSKKKIDAKANKILGESTKASIGHHKRMGSPRHKEIADHIQKGHDHYNDIGNGKK